MPTHNFYLQAFVVFQSPDEARRATQKDRETFGEKYGDRYVRVYPTLESDIADMQAAVAAQQTVMQVQASLYPKALIVMCCDGCPRYQPACTACAWVL